MEELYPLTFCTNVHTALWGQESWEISGHAASPSVVADGAFAGRTLADLASAYGFSFMGTKAPRQDAFPLLFKVIDAKSNLSVQVHPNETTCARTGGEPKTEMWCVLGGSGSIFAGLKPGTTAAQVEEYVRNGRFEDSLVRHEAREGLTLFIPGGMVHSIGADVRTYEVQQSSNTTYRLYDWGRVDAEGRPRQLHVQEALQSIDFDLPAPTARDDVSCAFFKFRSVEAMGALEIPANPETFTALYIVNEGRSVLVPANCAARVECNGKVLVTTL